ncbi:metal-dependent hydrolase [Nocardiopsis ansamitocini]|uniref:Membrane protein n=1 Tax=Nocardiopsis ansamitocini TaxID=1670832 RepID=A0A9W6P8K8_9ACTN|nr:metal-dependent hydrolase [Nocardiopsis ansamitocini]GLU48968.1 membrane protein [Nocardiopsis ansamitocini]
MMGPSHAATGLAAGTAVTMTMAAAGVSLSLPDIIAAILVCAGAALLPDLDHPDATATRSQGPVSEAASAVARAASTAVWRATRTHYDRGGHDRDGAHRHLTHTVLAAVVAGLLVAGAGQWLPLLTVLLWFLLSLAVRGLWGCVRARRANWGAVSLLAGAATWLLIDAGVSPSLMGLTVAVGMITHSLGDALTKAGAPLLWPVRMRGQRWRMLGPAHRITVGGAPEAAIRWGSLVAAPLLVVLAA